MAGILFHVIYLIQINNFHLILHLQIIATWAHNNNNKNKENRNKRDKDWNGKGLSDNTKWIINKGSTKRQNKWMKEYSVIENDKNSSNNWLEKTITLNISMWLEKLRM
jgi:hypothetical protein